jgi:hypothetical protein
MTSVAVLFGLLERTAHSVGGFSLCRLPQRATASNGESNRTLNVLTLEQTIDATALPRQEIPDEVYR